MNIIISICSILKELWEYAVALVKNIGVFAHIRGVASHSEILLHTTNKTPQKIFLNSSRSNSANEYKEGTIKHEK